MKQLFTILIFSSLLSCSERSPTLSDNNRKEVKNDTAYVTIDSLTINKADNTFEFILVFESDNQRYEIYREKNRDYSVEFKFSSSYRNNNLNFEQFNIADLPTGRSKDVVRDKNSNIFYLTDWYDDRAGGDSLIKATVNFKTRRIKAKSFDISYPDYEVKLTKIWEPTEGYKIK